MPPEVVAVLGDPQFALPRRGSNSFMAQDRAGKYLAVPNVGAVVLFDPRTGAVIRTLPDEGRAYSVAFSPDGKTLVSANNQGAVGKPIKVWNVETGEVTASFGTASEWVGSVAFHPDGKRVFASGSKGLEVFDLTDGKLVRTLASANLWQLAVSPDGKSVIGRAPDRNAALVYDPDTGEVVKTLDGFDNTVDAAFTASDWPSEATRNC